MPSQIIQFTAGFFQPGTNDLGLYRNGLKLVNVEQYSEISNTRVSIVAPLGVGDKIAGQVRGRQLGGHPGLYSLYEQPAAVAAAVPVLITIPAYTTGNNSLLVFRNGKLLHQVSGEYVEVNTTTVRVFGSLNAGDLFEFIIRGQNFDGTPVVFEDFAVVGGLNEEFVFASPYIVGSDTLEVWRNGKRLFNTFGFDELTSTKIRYNGTTLATDTVIALVRAESAVFGTAVVC